MSGGISPLFSKPYVRFFAPTFFSLTVVGTAVGSNAKKSSLYEREAGGVFYTGSPGLSRKKCWTDACKPVFLLV